MTTLSIVEARNHLADVINRVSYAGERIIFARQGKAVAALISARDLSLLQRIEDAEDTRAATKVLKEYERNPSTFSTLEEYKRQRRGKA